MKRLFRNFLAYRFGIYITRKAKADFSIDNLQNKKRILVACFPKSGSTYLSNLLAEVLNFKKLRIYGESRGNEQYLCREQIIVNRNCDFVTQAHIPATIPNKEVIKWGNFQTIILTRDIFDTLLSLHEFIYKKKFQRVEFAAAFLDNYFNLSVEDQKWFLVKLVAPWYIKFYVSWVKEQEIDKIHITYEQLVDNQVQTISKILDFLIFVPEVAGGGDISMAINKVEIQGNNRKNVGITGRGRKHFSKEQQAHVEQYKKFYDDVDFQYMGL